MRAQVIHLHREAPPKPAPGQPCNGCGVCCAAETCPAARLRFLRVKGPCPALDWDAARGQYRCGFLARPQDFFPGLPVNGLRCFFARHIAAGDGCDCDLEPQPPQA